MEAFNINFSNNGEPMSGCYGQPNASILLATMMMILGVSWEHYGLYLRTASHCWSILTGQSYQYSSLSVSVSVCTYGCTTVCAPASVSFCELSDSNQRCFDFTISDPQQLWRL